VAVVAAGMHAAGMGAGVAEGVCFLNRQRVHVRPQADGTSRVPRARPLAAQRGDDTGLAHAAFQRQAQRGQVRGDLAGSARLLELQLGMGMQVAPQADEPAQVRRDVGK
jgi:hypothetical protein